MNYSTYISAAEKLSSFGQKQRASLFIKHANDLEQKKIDDLKFNILVGEVRPFKDARFHSVQVIREREANSIMCIFQSDTNNTHRINAKIKPGGEVQWSDGNLFLDRQSVKSYERLLDYLTSYQNDVQKLLGEIEIKREDLKIINRSFYI
jgi:hypothetical protein